MPENKDGLDEKQPAFIVTHENSSLDSVIIMNDKTGDSTDGNEYQFQEATKMVNDTLNKSFRPDREELSNIKTQYFNGVEISKLTKRQMKKYQKSLKWQSVKKEKRLKERMKAKEKRKIAKLNNIDLGPSRKELKRAKMDNSPCKIGVCIDLSFDDLMSDKDMAKTIKQILRVYTENRRAKAPMQLHLCSFNGRSKEEMTRHHGYENWDIKFHEQDYIHVFPKEKLVYLSSESENIITKLEEDKIYIIGGLVDHNLHKGLCHKKAIDQGIEHGQLPIGEYFWMKHRKVLTINQVFEIILRVSEGKSFKEAFELILPRRIEKRATDEDTKIEGNSFTQISSKLEAEDKQELSSYEQSSNIKENLCLEGEGGCDR